MPRVLIIDDVPAFSSKIAEDVIKHQLADECVQLQQLHLLPPALEMAEFDLALVDLSFPLQRPRSGVDAVLYLQTHAPTTSIALLSQGDEFVADMIRDLWEAFPLVSALSKSRFDHIESVGQLLLRQPVPPDPDVRMFLPATRNPNRSLHEYRRLLPMHAGLRRLWKALIAVRGDVNPRTVAALTETPTQKPLSPASIAAYRQLVLADLEKHGLISPSLAEMAQFARRVLLDAMDEPDLLVGPSPIL
jgi:CheY-like chemotaxis protein